MYSREEAFKECLIYFNGDELAANVFIDKYALKDKQGNLLEKDPEDMHRRMTHEFKKIEDKYPNPMSYLEIFELFNKFKYIIPGGSQMAGVGNNSAITSLSNCFVIDSAIDSYGGIMRADEEQIQIMKRRGGVGHDLSNLRPSGVSANNSILGQMAGATLYMDRFSNSTREVAQDGRRGALMLSIDVRHPDCDKFIDAKLKEGKVIGANISVRISDDFMKAVESDEDFLQCFPIDTQIKYHTAFYESLYSNLIEYDKLYSLQYENSNEFKGCFAKRIKAKELWNKIIKNAHQSAEPGVLFWDTIIKESPADCYGTSWKSISCNPCAELPLCAYDSCRLTNINLYSYVNDPFTSKASFDYELFKDHVNKAQRLMDDTVDLEIEKIDKILDKIEKDPEPEEIKLTEFKLWLKIRQKAIEGRRTGLGITAEADMLAALGLRYGTPEATEFSINIHRILAIESYRSSIQLAKERGSFPIWNWRNENSNPFLCRVLNDINLHNYEDYISFGRRNIANLTIAPTGTVSLMTQTTSGIEPLFKPFYKRKRKVNKPTSKTTTDQNGDIWEEYFVIHPKFVEWFIIQFNFKISDNSNIIEAAIKELNSFSENDLQELFERSPYYKATANDIDWKESVRMQGEVQKWIDHSISKTVNLPSETTIEQVDELYRLAWSSGCKGLTIYRDGSREGVLTSSTKEEKKEFDYLNSIKIPKERECDIYHKTALKKSWTIIVGKVDNKPVEIFAFSDIDNSKFPSSITKGIIRKEKSRLYSLTSKGSEKTYKIDSIVDLMTDLDGIDTRKYSLMLRHRINPQFIIDQIREYATISSFDKVIEKVLMLYIKEERSEKELCPNCKSKLVRQEGCVKCTQCEWSKCG